ncbi:alpha/beta fold hydrolase [Lactococcus cremoris]|uniref:Hydrolase n=1 Tax=Lactococcus cremoris subsp. cremoris GE214 TaxID=1415168 RepID=A0A084A9H1_LACLC|nr:alpha/beta fold hydrolase [Lactococcus cremoris]KEY61950.1 Hydrolase [Lactococcus cremoris subsp. cremoris GE214]
MAIHEVEFKSFNEIETVKGWIYTPIREPIGVVQIVHGYGEHSRRYLHMILTLNEAGFVVAADDHVGHGKTAYDSDNWSNWGDKGYMTMAEDEQKLRELIKEDYGDLPYFMFGHSMGSMIARLYATEYGEELDGLILCGTSEIFPEMENIVSELKAEIDAGNGEQVDPDYQNRMFEWMTERIENPNTPNDWTSKDPDIVADHANDPFNNFTSVPNIQSLYQLAQMIQQILGTEWSEKVPTDIPTYNIAGDEDPVGRYGEGVYAVSNWLLETGHQVKTKLYSGYRHEIHNHREIRDEVVAGIIDFITEHARVKAN